MENNSYLNTPMPPLQFISCEDKAMNFYEELLREEKDSNVKIELIKSYSELILKRISLNELYAKNNNAYALALLNANLEIDKLRIETQKTNQW